jgi:hypothetical protein
MTVCPHENDVSAPNRWFVALVGFVRNDRSYAARPRRLAFFASTLYKARSRFEQGVGRLKRFKRVALCCEKTARNFRSIVSFAAGLCLIKFVHTA